MSFFRELKRRNVFRVAVAYGVVGWLLVEVASVLFETFEAPAWVMKVFATVIIMGFPLAMFFAWAYELTPDGLKKEKDVDRGQSITAQTGRKIDYIIIGLLSVAVVFFASTHQWLGESADDSDIVEIAASGVKSIAVLPFVNMSDDPGNEYFSDGIAEELLNVLVRVEGLRVASRTSSFSFKGKDISIPVIAKALNVDHVLEGSVRKAGNTVRITAQLIDVRTDSHLWSATYDRELEDIFAIQDEISGHIVQALKIVLGAEDQQAIADARKATENVEAYELYLRGRYFWQRRGEDNIRRAIGMFEQATALDPQFARAWSSLGAAHVTLPTYSDTPIAEQYPLAVSAAQKALTLDDSLAEAYAVLGDMARVDNEWSSAHAYYLRAIASEPKNSTAHLWYGEHLLSVGRIRDALEETLIAYRLDPLHPGTNTNLGQIYLWLDDAGNTLKYGEAAWELGHAVGLYLQSGANLWLGKIERAIELAEQFGEQLGDAGMSSGLKLFLEARGGDTAKRSLYLQMLAENESAWPLFIVVPGYAAFDRIDDAYRSVNLARGSIVGNDWDMFWRGDMAAFRQDPRFAELVTEGGLVDYWRKYGWPDYCQPAGDSVSCQ